MKMFSTTYYISLIRVPDEVAERLSLKGSLSGFRKPSIPYPGHSRVKHQRNPTSDMVSALAVAYNRDQATDTRTLPEVIPFRIVHAFKLLYDYQHRNCAHNARNDRQTSFHRLQT